MAADGVFIIGSALAAKGMLSVYDDEERFKQLLTTISSIDHYMPYNIKILFDASPDLSIDKFAILNRIGVQTIHTGGYAHIAESSKKEKKSEGEAFSVLEILKFIKENEITAKRIYKISGRYWLNNNFNSCLEYSNMFAFAKSHPTWYGYYRDENELIQIGANRYYQTRLWSADYSLLDQCIDSLDRVAKDCIKYDIDIEHSFYKEFSHKPVIELDKIGVSGNIAPSGMYVED